MALAVAGLEGQAPQTPQPAQPPPATPAPAPADQPPVFRTGVEVLPIDVTVLDRDGRQVTDLTTAEFQVEVDGKARKVLTSEYIKLIDPLAAGQRRATFDNRAAVAAPAPDTGISTNGESGEPPGRAILLLVDQGNIRFGSARPVMQNALQFVDRLQPNDRIALVAVPAPGELVDFTTRPRQGARRDAARHRPAHRRRRAASTCR